MRLPTPEGVNCSQCPVQGSKSGESAGGSERPQALFLLGAGPRLERGSPKSSVRLSQVLPVRSRTLGGIVG